MVHEWERMKGARRQKKRWDSLQSPSESNGEARQAWSRGKKTTCEGSKRQYGKVRTREGEQQLLRRKQGGGQRKPKSGYGGGSETID